MGSCPYPVTQSNVAETHIINGTLTVSEMIAFQAQKTTVVTAGLPSPYFTIPIGMNMCLVIDVQLIQIEVAVMTTQASIDQAFLLRFDVNKCQ